MSKDSNKKPKTKVQPKVVFEPLSSNQITKYFSEEVLSWMQYDNENADQLMKVIASLYKKAEEGGGANFTALLFLIAEKIYVHTTHGAKGFSEFSKENGYFQ